MTPRLNPEIKALRALNRAMDAVPAGAEQRCLEWLVASRCGLPGVSLPTVEQPQNGKSEKPETGA